MKIYYKIVEIKNNDHYFLFHGINGSRKIPINTWINANIKQNASDGVGNRYTSGIHVIDGHDNALSYLKRFKRNDRIIVACYAEGLKRKEKSKHYVYLADKIKLI